MNYQMFICIYDQFADYPQAKVEYYLEVATNDIDVCTYGASYSRAVGLLTAHLLTLNPSKPRLTEQQQAIAKLGFNPNSVKSIEIQEDITVEFNEPSATMGSSIASGLVNGLDATIYGQQLEALKRSLIIPFFGI